MPIRKVRSKRSVNTRGGGADAGTVGRSRTARQLKASRDESYGKFGSKAKKSGKINR